MLSLNKREYSVDKYPCVNWYKLIQAVNSLLSSSGMSLERKAILQRQLDSVSLKSNKDIEVINKSLANYNVETVENFLGKSFQKLQ